MNAFTTALLFLGLISVPPAFAQIPAQGSSAMFSCDAALSKISSMSIEFGSQVIATRARVSDDEQKASEDDFNRKLELAKTVAKAACK